MPNDEIELMSQEEIDAFMRRMAAFECKRARREQRNRWLRTYGLGILVVILVLQVIALGRLAGAF